jgi:hypothetical protein
MLIRFDFDRPGMSVSEYCGGVLSSTTPTMFGGGSTHGKTQNTRGIEHADRIGWRTARKEAKAKAPPEQETALDVLPIHVGSAVRVRQ